VHTDFRNEIANFGDVVNTRKPATFTAIRKVDTDDITVQDASADNIQVPLNQHWHTSFLLNDGALSKSFKDLRAEFLQPAVMSIAQAMDRVIFGQYPHFLANTEGKQDDYSSTTAKGYILDVHKRMNNNKVPLGGRNMFMCPNLEAETLKLDIFTAADQVGDGGTALREATLGRKLGFNMYMVQNMPSFAGQTQSTASAALVDNVGGYAAGSTLVHVDTAGSSLEVGQWIVFNDDGTPQQITALGSLATQDIDVTIAPGLRRAVANDDTVRVYAQGAVNLTAGYASGWSKEIVVDGFTGAAVNVGQIVTFGTSTIKYSVVSTTLSSGNTVGIVLDRPLEAALANNDKVYTGPGGNYSLIMDRPAIALVSRPLALPESSLGARAAVANLGGFGLRVVMAYDPYKQGILTTVDVLAGIKVLDSQRGVVLIG
jgi:hypothetical protein